MNNKTAMMLVLFFGIMLLGALLTLQTCSGPRSSEMQGSFKIVIKAYCPIAKDDQQFLTDVKLLSTTFSAGNSEEKFFVPNLSLVRIDKLTPSSDDSASFDIPMGLMHYFKTSLVEGAQMKEMRIDEEKTYFANLDNESDFSDFKNKALRPHDDEVLLKIPNCLDSNEFIIGSLPPGACANKYWNDVASLKKYIEKKFGISPPSGDIIIYYLCGIEEPIKTKDCIDSDDDSVCDDEDDCPEIAGKPVHKGCPDSDNDGVKDEWDKCPNDPGPAPNGCPSIKKTNQTTATSLKANVDVSISHNNNSGQFIVSKFDNNSMISEVIITLRNGKEVRVTPSSYIFPATSTEFNKLTQNITQGAGLFVKFIVYDKGTKEVLQSFDLSNVSLVCIPSSNGKDTECGFIQMR
jgi:hypothetical protein